MMKDNLKNKKLIIATITTKKTIKEFLLLKYSIEKFHEVEWYVATDKSSVIDLSIFFNVYPFVFIDSDDCDHNVNDIDKNDRWMNVMMTKFDICQEALKYNNYVLFVDCDMLFVNKIEDRILNLFFNKDIDAGICQHMTNDFMNEGKHGFYNAGMVFVRNKDFLNLWKDLSLNYKKYNLYYEQKPLELIQQQFVTFNFPINYNIGWWRFNRNHLIHRLQEFKLNNDSLLLFYNKPAINFHMHCLRDLETQNFGEFLVKNIFQFLNLSKNNIYKDIEQEYKRLLII